MNDRATGPSWLLPKLRRVAVAHTQGDRVRLVVAESGGGEGEGARILQTETFPLTSLPDLRAALAKHHVRHLIRIAAAGRSIARAVQIPMAETSDLLTALELMAEAQLSSVPDPHRRGWGVLEATSGSATASALVVGWLADAPAPILDGPNPGLNESWTSELVALALLLPPDAPSSVACADRTTGSIGIASREAGGSLRIRSVREDPGDSVRFDRAIAEMRDSMVGDGGGAAPATDAATTVLLSPGVRDRLTALTPEASQPMWLARYALAAGVALAILDERRFAMVRALASLRAEPPPRVMSPLERTLRWVSLPRHAAAVIAIGLIVALFVPWGLASARAAMLRSRVASTTEGGADTAQLQKRGDFMAELSHRRWPVSKLLGDIAGSMPVGVQFESVSFTPVDKLQIRGIADSNANLTKFTTNLNDTGVFQGASVDSRERVAEGFTFDISSARVIRPSAEAKGLDDFAAKSLGVRLYGDSYKEIEAAEQAKQQEAEAKQHTLAGTSGRRGEVFNSGSSRQPAEEPIPEPLSQEKISKLDRTEAGKEMSARRKAASRAGLDPEIKKRLNEEIESLRARLAELKGTTG